MKRCIAMALCAILLVTLLSACGKSAAILRAAADLIDREPDAAEETSAPEGFGSILESALDKPASSTLPPTDAPDEYEPTEGAPLDPDEYEPTEGAPLDPEPVTVPMSADEQYEANIFLSNFAEQFFGNYDETDADAADRQLDFAHLFAKINRRDAIEYKQRDGMAYETMSSDSVSDIVTRYFPVSFSPLDTTDNEYRFYADGAFWYMAADGEAYNRFAVVDTLTRLNDGRYAMTFTVYELDLETYWDSGLSSAYYRMTPDEASAAPELSAVRTGYAEALPYDAGEHSTYRLISYQTQ